MAFIIGNKLMQLNFHSTIKQQLLILTPFLVVNSLTAIGYLYFFYGSRIGTPIIILLIVMFAINALPVIILHIQYFIANWGELLVIDTDLKLVTYTKGKKEIKFSLREIKKLKYYASSGYISRKGSSGWYTFDPYRFYKIELLNDEKIVITCLMIYKIEERLEVLLDKTADRIFRGMPLIY